jgi:hypothetical protein
MSTETGSAGAEFVGGIAHEQTEEMDVGGAENPNRDAAVEAVKKAMGKAKAAAPKEDAEEAPEAAEAPAKGRSARDADASAKAEAKEKPAEEEDEYALKKVLATRQKVAEKKKAEADELRVYQEQIQRERQELDHQRRQMQAEMARIQKLKTDPVSAVREAGYDPEQFILDLARSGTPEGQAEARLRQMQEQIQQQEQFRQQLMQQQQNYLRQQQEQQERNHRYTVEQQFLESAMDDKRAPHTAAFYKGREAALISEGDLIAIQYRQLTGREATPAQIAEYIEESLAERAKAWYESVAKQNTSSPEVGDEDDVAEPVAKGVKKAGKTLNPDSTGERRSLSSRYADMDEEERIETAKAEVRKALNKYRRPTDD